MPKGFKNLNQAENLESKRQTNSIKTPLHIAIIMDGNGRWAKKHGLPRIQGHRKGVDNIRNIVRIAMINKIQYLTLYAFSTENWSRPASEVHGLIELLASVIDRETKELHKQNIRIKHLGRTENLSQNLQRSIQKAVEITKNNIGLTLNVAFDYGGRNELLEAAKNIIREKVNPDLLDETSFEKYLYSSGIPDPDLIIRTAGEMRLSNFLLWQTAYSEYYFTKTLWPDFDEIDMDKALSEYYKRKRQFGQIEDESN
ncbi:MAG: isoprenyl transferase [Chloroflexi bacterium]|nr:isoprenyl transferase [Chloroflexota bacterium]|tara:strand:+ start:1245 stop:2012 length:768 start_codon:yes stop_codon:yes gene_type:complete